MPRSMLTAAFLLSTLSACAQTSAPTTTAPVVASASPDPVAASAPVPTATTSASTPTSTPTPTPTDDSSGAAAQFRGCKTDSDCVAVPVAGCCDNGRKEAVAATQKDAYAQANACTRKRPICPMFRVLDKRVPYCDAQAHLCAMH